MVYGREIGESLTPHLQGFLVMPKTCRLSAMKKLHPTAHWEASKGSADQNRVYCTKDGNYIETGIIPSAKSKGAKEIERWDMARAAAVAGDFDSIPSDIYMRNHSTIKRMFLESQPVVDALSGVLINEWLWGPPGTGKSTRAFQENPSLYLKGLTKWWDGYVGQQAVLVDDMDPFHKSLAREFKLWGQHQPFTAESKGSGSVIRPAKIVVTSNYNIDQIWEDPTTRAAMHRRYTEIYMGPPMLYPLFVPDCDLTKQKDK